MSTARIVLCPGQGAQSVGMGKAWHAASAEARAIFEQADRILGSRLGAPLSQLCFEGPAERLNQTDASQPAIYVASVASWRGMLAGWGAGAQSAAPEAGVVATAGLSLGEYTALHLAGVFEFEEGLELVALRGRAMQDAADAIKAADGAPGSGMVALIGATEAQAEEVCDRARGSEVLVSANFNAPGQVVVSGSIGACGRAATVAAELGLRAAALPVAGAFHSPLMKPAADRLSDALKQTRMKPAQCAVASNVTGQGHETTGSAGRTVEDSIRVRLVEQLTMPVRWEQNCRWLAGLGGTEWHELAPGKTLAGLMRRIEKGTKVQTHDEP